MTMKTRLLLAIVLFAATTAFAGQSCELREPKPAEIRSGLQLAQKVNRYLDAQGARVAVIGRVGRDLSEYRLRYSHIGLAVRNDAQGRWDVVHMLNHCGRADADLYDQGLGNFFLDDLFRFEAVVLVPTPELQDRLAAAVAEGKGRAVFEANYSLIAHPYSAKYQNSNQWLLEFAAAVASGGDFTRAAAHSRMREEDFQPSVLTLPPLKRLGARLFAVNTRFDDHSNEEWSSSLYQVVSAESVLAWFTRTGRSMGQSVVKLP